MEIRAETASDFARVEEVVRAAFGGDEEARLVARLRSRPDVLSLVADEAGRVVGHVLFSPVTVARREGARGVLVARGLAPLAVLPERQRRRVGTRLVEAGLARLRSEGVALVVVLGHADYYARFGFVAAAPLGLRCKWGGEEGSFRVLDVVPGASTSCRGLVEYDAAFDAGAW